MLTTNLAADTFFGVSITDGVHVLYYVFSEKTLTSRTITYATNTTIITPISGQQWNVLHLPGESTWTNQGWVIPNEVTVTFFVRASSPGIFYAGINQAESATI
jgi:hypothetical protein